MVFQDWELGVAESMGIVILIGFSVDYVVHLSSHYIHSPHGKRFNRM
jgi:predicted RND superfamily exporter protein